MLCWCCGRLRCLRTFSNAGTQGRVCQKSSVHPKNFKNLSVLGSWFFGRVFSVNQDGDCSVMVSQMVVSRLNPSLCVVLLGDCGLRESHILPFYPRVSYLILYYLKSLCASSTGKQFLKNDSHNLFLGGDVIGGAHDWATTLLRFSNCSRPLIQASKASFLAVRVAIPCPSSTA